MADKHPTQAIPEDGRAGQADGTGVPKDPRGAGGRGPTGPKDKGKPFHGGQSDPGYYGDDQLGDEKVGKRENPNAPSRED